MHNRSILSQVATRATLAGKIVATGIMVGIAFTSLLGFMAAPIVINHIWKLDDE